MSGASIELIVPKGMFGPEKDYLIDSIIRAIADLFAEEGEWADKYGVNFENETFMMHKFCWCESEDCKWCSGELPNFHYKPFDFQVTWYKYIGRGMQYNKELSIQECAAMLSDCINTKKQ